MNTNRQQLFMGLPESGKTTFLAALWYFIRYSNDAKALKATLLPAEREYLNEICDVWSRGKEQQHTSHSQIIDITLHLNDPTTKAESDLLIPDLSGELFRSHWADRTWSLKYNGLAENCDGVVLFIHPNLIDPPVTIAQVNAAAKAMQDEDANGEEEDGEKEDGGGQAGDGEEAKDSADDAPRPFDPLEVPPQVMLLDQLQCLIGPPCGHPALKISVVISAWDEVKAEGKTPDEWFHSHVRFLGQFLKANRHRLSMRCFGVSAQGCDYGDESARKEKLKLGSPIERVEVYAADGEQQDITAPIRWMLSSSNDLAGKE